jgi:hypothetical protein
MLRNRSSTGGVLNLVKRLFSSSNQLLSGLPPTVLEQLAVAPFAVEKVGEQLTCCAAQHSTQAAQTGAGKPPHVVFGTAYTPRLVCSGQMYVFTLPGTAAAAAA